MYFVHQRSVVKSSEMIITQRKRILRTRNEVSGVPECTRDPLMWIPLDDRSLIFFSWKNTLPPPMNRPLKEEHTAVRKPSTAQQFRGFWLLSWRQKCMGEIGCGHLVEYHSGQLVEKTATDIINFCALQNSKKVSSLPKIRSVSNKLTKEIQTIGAYANSCVLLL